MHSLFQNKERTSPQIGRTAGLSIAVHALILAAIVISTIHLHRTVVFRPMIKGSASSVSMIAISRGAIASAIAPKNSVPEKSVLPAPRPVRHLNPLPAKPVPELQTSMPSQSSSEQAAAGKSNPGTSGAGSDTQSMYPAYPTVSPSPQVKDRSLLPPTDQKVVVDVDLSANGQVQEAKLVSGLGNALDQVVLDTVRGWQFHPAMLNGGPVPSSMELVFPFNRNYPTAE
jgi:TonB family protein